MERRNRNRLTMSEFCRLAPASSRRRTSWKRIENISSGGMLLSWSNGEPDVKLPHIGEVYVVELQLPAHPVFGQRALQYKAKVVRVLKQPNGRVTAAFESSQTRFKSIRGAAWAEHNRCEVVN